LDERADGVYCIFDQTDLEGLVEESLFWMEELTVFIAFLTKTILKAWLRKVFFG
jgi:hypothetical protein